MRNRALRKKVFILLMVSLLLLSFQSLQGSLASAGSISSSSSWVGTASVVSFLP